MRYSFLLIAVLLMVGGYVSYRLPGFAGRSLALTFTLLVFALALSGLWTSGQTEQYILGGIFPYSDAGNYYFDALRALEGTVFGTFSASRPLYPALLASILVLTRLDFEKALLLQNLLPALATYFSVREVQRTHGTLAGAVFLTVSYFYFRFYIGAAMSEVLGYSLGLAAFALLWRCATLPGAASYRKTGWLGLAGIFLLTLALNARNGAFFVLPLLAIWLAWLMKQDRKFSWPYLGWGVLAAAAGFLLTKGISLLVTDPNNNGDYHLAMQLYSLVTGGKEWIALINDHNELTKLSTNQLFIQSLGIDYKYFLGHPAALFKGLSINWVSYFLDINRGGYSFLGGTSSAASQAARILMLGLGAAGLLACVLRRNRPESWLILAASLGNFLSIPFVPPLNTFNLRLFAATIWVEGIAPAVGLTFLIHQLSKKRWPRLEKELCSAATAAVEGSGVLIYSALLLLLMTAGPLLVRAAARPTALPAQSSCSASQTAVFTRLEPGGYLALIDNSDPRNSGMLPYVRMAFFKSKIHNMADSLIYGDFEHLTAPTALIYNLNLVSKVRLLIFAPLSMLPKQPGLIMACGHYKVKPIVSLNEYFFYADSLTLVPSQIK
ncbi:MAG: hypothetical protein P4L50_24165 [Anaerolineaceae bacterium]|nr:hypothetical protein [Anaerolineaceae bacterium]